MPYFLSNSITEAITTDEQSVSGMNPIFTSFFSGASEPCAHAPVRTASGTKLSRLVAAAAFSNSRFFINRLPENKKAFGITRTPLFVCGGRVVAPFARYLRNGCANGLSLITKDFLKTLSTTHVHRTKLMHRNE